MNDCPKCGAFSKLLTTKYLPLKQVPYFATFQPAERLTLCKVCGFYGTHPLEMLEKGITGRMRFWTNDELNKMKENR